MDHFGNRVGMQFATVWLETVFRVVKFAELLSLGLMYESRQGGMSGWDTVPRSGERLRVVPGCNVRWLLVQNVRRHFGDE